MSKLLHNAAQSYTENTEDKKLGRGLLPPPEQTQPKDLPDHMASERKLVMRQAIALLDKTISKSLSLRGITPEIYQHRHKLGGALWALLRDRFKKAGADRNEIGELRRRWDAKVHPYAQEAFDLSGSYDDKNHKKLVKWQAAKLEEERAAAKAAGGNPHDIQPPAFEDALRKWGHVFWPEDGGPISYKEIAEKMLAHLYDQELTIKEGAPRQERKKSLPKPADTGVGLMARRGAITANSANDPRSQSTRLERGWADDTSRAQKTTTVTSAYDDDTQAFIDYFSPGDLAAKIQRELMEAVKNEEPIFNAWFGKRTHEHFKAVGEAAGIPEDDDKRQARWNLHNAIRNYYKKLVKTEKFRRAVSELKSHLDNQGSPGFVSAEARLKTLVPGNKAQLMARLSAGVENADMSQAVRLGKMLVHSAITTGFGAGSEDSFAKRMDHFATSDGQSEIKRIETFARVWRQSNAAAMRTLAGLTGFHDDDLAKAGPSLTVATSQDHLDRVHRQLPVILGNKRVSIAGVEYPRVSVLARDPQTTAHREILWGLLRVAGNVRHAVNHFNVRPKLLALIENGIVEPVKNPIPLGEQLGGNQRNGKQIDADADQAFEALLGHDKQMRVIAAREELRAIEAHNFLSLDHLKMVVAELGKGAPFEALSPPRFTAVLNNLHALDQNKDTRVHAELAPLLSVKKDERGLIGDKDNMCRKGLFQMLYQSGFQAWFGKQAEDKGNAHYREVIDIVIKQKNDRAEAFGKSTFKKNIPKVSELAENLGVENYDCFKDLLEALAKQALRETDQDIRYRAIKGVQQEVSSRIEKFRQEVSAHMFVRYLAEQHLGFIAEIEEATEAAETKLDEAMTAFADDSIEAPQPWHHRFYTWLYLVPPLQVSRLRHQMRKSIALERKSNLETDDDANAMLKDMDALMGLYSKVQAAGFTDTEHEVEFSNRELEIGKLKRSMTPAEFLYEDPDLFAETQSDEDQEAGDDTPKAVDQTISGTKRGLRQIVRFGDLDKLKDLFSSHAVTSAEVQAFKRDREGDTEAMFKDYHQLRAEITKLSKLYPFEQRNREKQKKELSDNIATYRDLAFKVAKHDFDANAARLADHVKCHRILISILGRLADYAAVWERDVIFAFYGMLYRDLGCADLVPVLDTERGTKEDAFGEDRIGFLTSDTDKQSKLAAIPGHRPEFIGLVKSKIGFLESYIEPKNANSESLSDLLSAADKSHFLRAFGEIVENPADERARKNAKRKGDKNRDAPVGEYRKKRNIRNDLAHMNPMQTDKPLKLTYLINATRGLMAYDQKLKNAVVKSVKRILAEEGLTIEWRMAEDRLTRPQVFPLVEQHLKMLPREFADDPILIPRASVRLTSMVQALFDFGNSGYSEESGSNKGREISYPAIFFERTKASEEQWKDAAKVEISYKK